MTKNKKEQQNKRRGRVQIKFNTGQRIHKSKKDYKRNNKVEIPNNKEEFDITLKILDSIYAELINALQEGKE